MRPKEILGLFLGQVLVMAVMGSLLGFRDVRVSDIMTPRPVVCSLRAETRLRAHAGTLPAALAVGVPLG